MFAYCNNNPVTHHDSTGQIPVGALIPVGIMIFGAVNNAINAYKYENADGESNLTSTSYQEKNLSRSEKLDYTKQQTGEEHYNLNAWRYYSEYTFHEHGWYLTKWAYQKDVPLFSEMALHFSSAEVKPDQWDVWGVNICTVIWGILGL